MSLDPATHQENTPWSSALLPLGLLWLTFGGLDLWLWWDGHRPTFIGNGLPADHYYLLQAIFIGPVMALGCGIWVGVALGVARKFGATALKWSPLYRGFARVLGVSVTLAYVIPDLIAYGGWGFSALAPTARIAAPICLLLLLGASSRALAKLGNISVIRAFVASFAGFFAMTLVVALVVR